MKSIYITGVGLVTENIENTRELRKLDIYSRPLVQPADDMTTILNKAYLFKSKEHVSREDKALLSKSALLAIDTALDAFKHAETDAKFTDNDRLNMPVYIGSEPAEHNLSSLDNLLSDNHSDVKTSLNTLGMIKKYLNPLDMLRTLSTNPLYHVSKVLQLQGGGYPIRRMSLSGLVALQEAYRQIQQQHSRAMVISVGDLTNPENLCAFSKMDLVRLGNKTDGILPSYGAGTIVLESGESCDPNKILYAKLLTVESIYKNDTSVACHDWVELYEKIKQTHQLNNLHVVLYDNGVNSLSECERQAVSQSFPNAITHSYKKYIGYTGKANNLIDLIISLTDITIPCGSKVLVNGIGTSCGFGSILVEKTNHV